MVRVSVPRPELFDADWLLAFLRARQVAAVESIGAHSIERRFQVAGDPAALRIVIGARGITAECTAAMPPGDLRGLVRRLLDLDTNLAPFYRLAQRDPLLGPLVRARPGLRVPQALDPFECLVRAMLGQQVSVAAATTLADRMVRRLGDGCFPNANGIADAGVARIRRIGLPRARASSLHAVATAVADGRVDFETLRAAPPAEAQRALETLPGIGPWTAAYVRMRGLGDRDAFPSSDLGVLRAMGVSAREAERRAARWQPWRAYSVMHLWSR